MTKISQAIPIYQLLVNLMKIEDPKFIPWKSYRFFQEINPSLHPAAAQRHDDMIHFPKALTSRYGSNKAGKKGNVSMGLQKEPAFLRQ